MSCEEWRNGVRWGVILSLCFVAACTGPEINPPLVIAPLGEEPGANEPDEGEPTEDSNTGEVAYDPAQNDGSPVEESERSTDTSVQPGGDALESNPEPGDKKVMIEATAGGGWTWSLASRAEGTASILPQSSGSPGCNEPTELSRPQLYLRFVEPRKFQ